MRTIKSERLKKLEAELQDLKHWFDMGLVPKSDLEKHKEEIAAIEERIEEEKQRLELLRESGESEDIAAPKRGATRGGYSEMPTIPDIDMAETAGGFDDESEESTDDKTKSDESDDSSDGSDTTFEEESYFSDKNRWKRGGIVDPDADEW